MQLPEEPAARLAAELASRMRSRCELCIGFYAQPAVEHTRLPVQSLETLSVFFTSGVA